MLVSPRLRTKRNKGKSQYIIRSLGKLEMYFII